MIKLMKKHEWANPQNKRDFWMHFFAVAGTSLLTLLCLLSQAGTIAIRQYFYMVLLAVGGYCFGRMIAAGLADEREKAHKT